MSMPLFIYFGHDTFKMLDETDEDMKEAFPISGKCKVFRSRKPLKDTDIQDIFLGWSYAIFQTGNKFYHAGFPNKGCDLTEVFKNLEGEDLIISCDETKVFACTRDGKFCCYSTQSIRPMIYNLSDQNLDIRNLITGDMFTIALMHDGSVSVVNKVGMLGLSLSPRYMPCPIAQIACGKEHTLFLSTSGQVFSFGSGSRGQLGHGTIESVTKPTLVEALDGIKIKSVDCGGWHSAAVSCDGDLYMWGWNESGQLGFPCAKMQIDSKPISEIENICCTPKFVEFDEERQIVSVTCGTQHTAVLTENAEVWTWGWNEYGQLGYKSDLLCDKPCKIVFDKNFVPKKLKCAFWSTLIWGILNI